MISSPTQQTIGMNLPFHSYFASGVSFAVTLYQSTRLRVRSFFCITCGGSCGDAIMPITAGSGSAARNFSINCW